MFIVVLPCLGMPYLFSNSSSKMASSKVFEQSRPSTNLIGLATLPILRCHMTGGTDVMQLMPTRARLDRPRSTASSMARVLAEYVYRLPAASRTSSLVAATPGRAFQSAQIGRAHV